MEPNALSPTLYEVLGVSERVTVEELRRLRRTLARRYHPDVAVCPDPARLSAILEACEVLGEPRRRADYDAHLARLRRRADATPPVPARERARAPSRERRSSPRARTAAVSWSTVRLQAFAYGLGAATVPGYATAYWIGSDLSSHAAQASPSVVLIDGPILAVLAIQAALAVALVVVVHTVRALRAGGDAASTSQQMRL